MDGWVRPLNSIWGDVFRYPWIFFLPLVTLLFSPRMAFVARKTVCIYGVHIHLCWVGYIPT